MKNLNWVFGTVLVNYKCDDGNLFNVCLTFLRCTELRIAMRPRPYAVHAQSWAVDGRENRLYIIYKQVFMFHQDIVSDRPSPRLRFGLGLTFFQGFGLGKKNAP